MRRLAAVICAVAALASAGCTQQSHARAAAIAFNIGEDPHSLDPILAQTDDEQQLARLAFDPLLDVDARGRLIPALARTVPTITNGGLSRDGMTIVYHLRRDVRWQDGAPFTARDVVFTWRAILDPRNAIASTRGYDDIQTIDTPDVYTAIVRLRRPWAPAVASLFTYGVHPVAIIPEHLLAGRALRDTGFDRSPVGTGPYRLTQWRRGDHLTYAANPRYYRGAPRTATIIVREVPDVNTDLTMLRTGDLDWSLLSPAQRIALGAAAGIHFVYAPFSGFGAIAFDCRKPPMDDPRMRRAIAMAIDRPRLSLDITRGQYPVTDSDQPTFSWAFDPAVRQPRYDAAAADASLDALGWRRGPDGIRRKDGEPLSLVFATFPEGDTAVRTAEMVQAMLRDRGIDVSVKRVTVTQFYLPKTEGGLLMNGGFDLAYMAWRSGADPDDSDLVTCDGASNFAGGCDPQIDALEARAVSDPDIRQRSTLYRDVQRRLAADLPYLFLYAPRYGFAVRDGVSGIEPTPFSPTWNAYAWTRR